MVKQTSWCCDQHFDAFFEFNRLRLHVHATKYHRTAELGVLGVELDLLGHLVGQLAGGQKHQRPHRVAGRRSRRVFMLEHALEQGQGERRRFTGSRLGRAHHVLAGKDHRDSLGLNRGHGFVAHLGDGAG